MFQFSGCRIRSTLKSCGVSSCLHISVSQICKIEVHILLSFMRKHFEKAKIQGAGINKVDTLLQTAEPEKAMGRELAA